MRQRMRLLNALHQKPSALADGCLPFDFLTAHGTEFDGLVCVVVQEAQQEFMGMDR